jgi:hypothetical protein
VPQHPHASIPIAVHVCEYGQVDPSSNPSLASVNGRGGRGGVSRSGGGEALFFFTHPIMRRMTGMFGGATLASLQLQRAELRRLAYLILVVL